MWLLVGAEEREFAGMLRRTRKVRELGWPGVGFAREVEWNGGRCLVAANGPGPELASRCLPDRETAAGQTITGLMSVGFCGALDPALGIGDIVVAGDCPAARDRMFVRGDVLSVNRVAVTTEEKRKLHQETGASVVEMESAAVREKALAWGVPFCCIRAVSDTAQENLPLDFNVYRDREGRFSRMKISLAALTHPFAAIPGLLRLERNCQTAAECLGEFLADCRL